MQLEIRPNVDMRFLEATVSVRMPVHSPEVFAVSPLELVPVPKRRNAVLTFVLLRISLDDSETHLSEVRAKSGELKTVATVQKPGKLLPLEVATMPTDSKTGEPVKHA
jgi:hypothetical protein